ncbi:MAG: DUF3857 domain-containing protein, partial [Sphingomonadales bacterium]|nr:DUF3857 domain-containing protein [Sphingomonadales bacterium]
MRLSTSALLMTTASAALANPAPDITPTPSWVKRVAIQTPTDTTDAPVRILLSDQQVSMTPGAVSTFVETAVMVQTAAGLSAGNIVIPWRPDLDTLAVHAMTITRKGKLIDVLATQKFTVIRRETNLEAATLDGRLTATLQIDGMEVGDIVDLAASVITRDPTLAGHVETSVAQWNGLPIDHAHARLRWSRDVPLRLRSAAGLPAVTTLADSGGKMIELTADHVQPLIPPKGAPARFAIGRILEATDYRSWAEFGALFAPLYGKASTIDPKGPLAQQIESIRAASDDPVIRAGAALDLVQNKIRYVALQMGQGGYVPAAADSTWANRLGDCKAKTALLLAMLHRLDIVAVPVVVSSANGDGMDGRLPLIALFDHVLVRATIAGKNYWLDGTRSGDRDLARLETPAFGWGLPLIPAGAQLVRMIPAPRVQPDNDYTLNIDARDGIFAPAKAHSELAYRGDAAEVLKLSLAALPDASRDTAIRDFWKGTYDFIEPAKVSAAFDPATGIERITMDGTALLKWDGSWLRIPGSSLAYAADFSRPAGPDSNAPFLANFPGYGRASTTIQLPPGITLWPGKVGHDIDQTLAGVAYHREAKLAGNVLHMVKSERTLVPEVEAATARTAQARLRALDDEDVQLQKGNYRATDADLVQLAKVTPESAQDFLERGLIYLQRTKYKEAIADFSNAHDLKPNDVWPLANRGLAHAWAGKVVEAETDFAAAGAIAPNNPVVARGRALLALRKGDQKAALADLTASLGTDPDNDFALRARAEINRGLGSYDAVIADTDALLRLNPDDVDVRLQRANLFKLQGRQDRMIAEAEAIQRAKPKDNYAQVVAAKIYAAAKKPDRAMAAFQLALDAKPEPFIYLNRMESRGIEDNIGRRADLEAALKLDPADEASLIAKAQFAFKQKEYHQAVAGFTAVLAKNPTDSQVLSYRGMAYFKDGDQAAANKDFAAAAAAAGNPTQMNSICWAKGTAGIALSSALQDCNRAISAAPENAAYLDSRGLVNLKLGRLDESIADYDAALKSSPRQSASLYGRSIAWARKGDAAKSKADLTAAQSISPD